jgi:hypothetical protein
MRRKITALICGLLVVASVPASVNAQTEDPLAQCLVSHTNASDRSALVKWIFSVMAASPEVSSMSSITPVQRDALSKAAGVIFTRLLTVDCRAEAIGSIKGGGPDALEKGFRVLGETAMTGLMSDPAVEKTMVGLLAGIDVQAWANLMIDAGEGPLKKLQKK